MDCVALADSVTDERCCIGGIPVPSHGPVLQRNPAVESVEPEHNLGAAVNSEKLTPRDPHRTKNY
jgi:hypothetical protein